MSNIKDTLRRVYHGAEFLRVATKQIATAKDWSAIINAVAESGVPFLGSGCIVCVDPPGGESIIASHSVLPPLRIQEIAAQLHAPGYQLRKFRRGDSPETDELLRLSESHFGWIIPLRTGDAFLGNIFLTQTSEQRSCSISVYRDYASLAAILLQDAWRSEQAQRSVSAQDDFLITASHELKTPVTTLRLQAYSLRKILSQTILMDSVSSAATHLLDLVERQMTRLENLIEGFLKATRFRSGRLELSLRATDLAGVVKRVIDRHLVEAQHAGCEIRLRIDSSPRGKWDPALLEQALSNLFLNAIKYGRGKPIEVRIFEEGGSACLSIRDLGIGIAEADLTRVFGRFERAVSVIDFSGFGVGLYVSRRIVEAHRGTIQIQSHAGEGAEFNVRLPFAENPAASSLSG